jgi:enoyl-CoA hydratase
MSQTAVVQEEAVVLLEKRDGIAVVTVNRPKALNALNRAVTDELERVFRTLADAADVHGVILTGAGEKSFIAGADIGSMANLTPEQARAWGAKGQGLLFMIENFPKPVIAAVNGYALGGGLEIAMSCDFIVAVPEAKLGQPEVLLGVIPGFGGSQRLARIVGYHKAKQLCMTGEQITGTEAYRIGLVSELVPKGELRARCEALLAKIGENGPIAVRFVREVINRGSQMDLEAACALELNAFAVCFATQDQKEGMKAFLEKRKATFSGR